MNVKTTETPISARIDALAGSRRLWSMIAILSFGAFFEIYASLFIAPRIAVFSALELKR